MTKEEIKKYKDWFNSLTIGQLKEIANKYYSGNIEKLFNIEEHLIFNIVKNISVSDIEENATLIRNWSYGEKIQINIFIYNYLNMTYRICKYNDKITIF